MLDHVFTDAIGALRDAIEGAMLERVNAEERFQNDVLLGDTSWETSYGIPGEQSTAQVRADVTLLWSTWAQSAYRSWLNGIDDPLTDAGERPIIEVGITLRIQHLSVAPDPQALLRVLPETGSPIGRESLARTSPTTETHYADDLTVKSHAIEITYEGNYELDEAALLDGATLDQHFAAMGGWIASTLVKIGDLKLH